MTHFLFTFSTCLADWAKKSRVQNAKATILKAGDRRHWNPWEKILTNQQELAIFHPIYPSSLGILK